MIDIWIYPFREKRPGNSRFAQGISRQQSVECANHQQGGLRTVQESRDEGGVDEVLLALADHQDDNVVDSPPDELRRHDSALEHIEALCQAEQVMVTSSVYSVQALWIDFSGGEHGKGWMVCAGDGLPNYERQSFEQPFSMVLALMEN
ncbi:hypothetical protein JTL77_33995 [Pseudomonas aeruginosa]|nr:hypothetical protein [Pseudomonas aeruginosa]